MPSLDLGSVVGPQGEQGATGAQGIRGEQGLPGPNQVTNSTATPLTGVLTGNGSVVGVANIDAAPTEDSLGFARSGGTYNAIKGRVPMYGLGKNLLDNWYFLNPVNQRGQSSYSASGAQFTIDRWRKVNCAVTVESDGIRITKTNTEMLRQAMPSAFWKSLLGQTVTLSVFGSDGLASATFTMPSTLGSWDTTGPVLNGLAIDIAGNSSADGACYIRFFSSSPNGTEWKLYAIKLELGTEQTICHNEGTAGTPVWVLNEIPDYEYELFRCMTSTADPNDTYANKTLATGEELAYVENGTTATKTNGYAVGEYFCWHGLLYRAKTAIGNGDTFTENTNCEVVTGGGINDLFGKKATVLFGTTGASSETLAVSAGRFLIILATRGDTSFTFAVVYRYNNWKLEGTNTAGVTVDANTGQITLLNYTHYKIIY